MSLCRLPAVCRLLPPSSRLLCTSAGQLAVQPAQPKTPPAATDPVAQLFVDKIRAYAAKQKPLGKGKLVDATADTQRDMTDVLNSVARQYRIESMAEAVKFPDVTFKPPTLDPIDTGGK